jgi:hypothetical protein
LISAIQNDTKSILDGYGAFPENVDEAIIPPEGYGLTIGNTIPQSRILSSDAIAHPPDHHQARQYLHSLNSKRSNVLFSCDFDLDS